MQTVEDAGFKGLENGDLLKAASGAYEVLITVDRNLAFQQNIPQFTIAVVVLESPTNRLKDLRPLLPKLQQLLLKVRKGEVSRVSL